MLATKLTSFTELGLLLEERHGKSLYEMEDTGLEIEGTELIDILRGFVRNDLVGYTSVNATIYSDLQCIASFSQSDKTDFDLYCNTDYKGVINNAQLSYKEGHIYIHAKNTYKIFVGRPSKHFGEQSCYFEIYYQDKYDNTSIFVNIRPKREEK